MQLALHNPSNLGQESRTMLPLEQVEGESAAEVFQQLPTSPAEGDVIYAVVPAASAAPEQQSPFQATLSAGYDEIYEPTHELHGENCYSPLFPFFGTYDEEGDCRFPILNHSDEFIDLGTPSIRLAVTAGLAYLIWRNLN